MRTVPVEELPRPLLGLHHVTAITGDPQRNLRFYSDVLGLRLVKLTVNFDDPTTYHIYYGDELGRPGAILTFFHWADVAKGRSGAGQLSAISFSIPKGSIQFWVDRFRNRGVLFDPLTSRFDEDVLSFKDPDGLQLELVQHDYNDLRGSWKDGPIPGKFGIRGIYSVTLTEKMSVGADSFLTGTLAFRTLCEESDRVRYEIGDGGPGTLLDLVSSPEMGPGFVGVGSVHHLAWRTVDDADQREWREEVVKHGWRVTHVTDRKYFRSIYFMEPGGALFEIATDLPGITVDESAGELGSGLMLPVWLESERERIEKALPRLELPRAIPAR